MGVRNAFGDMPTFHFHPVVLIQPEIILGGVESCSPAGLHDHDGLLRNLAMAAFPSFQILHGEPK
eukprot:scaffold1154_cov310-Pinguiococcus_pyrenoidosus.AAC.30